MRAKLALPNVRNLDNKSSSGEVSARLSSRKNNTDSSVMKPEESVLLYNKVLQLT